MAPKHTKQTHMPPRFSLDRLFIISLALLLVVAAVYFSLRLGPLLAHSVAYTYDQGRDMMKAAEIVLYKNPTFIGPTTGISGLFHGAWWYYYLTIPFILFGGEPIGFYFANIAIHFASVVLFFYILKKYMNLWVASAISLLTAIAPYFIATSLFIGNNIMTLPAMLIFVITHFIALEGLPQSRNAQWVLFALMGISLGLIAEFEFAFGLMIIPVYMVLIFLLPQLRKIYFSNFNSIVSLSGLFFAFLPRLLFEIRNGFVQTRTLLSFVIEPKLYNPKAYSDVFADRLDLVIGFYTVLFNNHLLMTIISTFAVLILVLAIWRVKKIVFQSSLVFFSLLILGLFLFSTVYKDNFWPNYYEGFPYLYLICMSIIFAQSRAVMESLKQKDLAIYAITVVLSVAAVTTVSQSLNRPVQAEGLSVQEDVVNYIVEQVGPTNSYCLRIYTPPVIPHTYDYLFFHEKRQGNIMERQSEFVDNKCFYIIERDDYEERKAAWLDQNLPQQGTMTSEKTFRDVVVQLWMITDDQ